jgi:hypothetical protein
MPDGTMVEGVSISRSRKPASDRRRLQDRSRDCGERRGRYRRQVALYASAIAQATGQAAHAVLIRV